VDLMQYKRGQMERRVRTWVQRRGAASLPVYGDLLRRDPDELDAFLDRVTINVSHLWRHEEQWDALRFAWPAIASVKSNAILIARGEQAIGIGAGQMSRVDSVFVAIHKARQAGHDPAGSVLASDGFFPFADNIELAAGAGITAIIQPGGSVRDPEVIAAANQLGIAMVMTGTRLFRH